MKSLNSKSFILIFVVALLSINSPALSQAAEDSRFFGKYCGALSVNIVVKVKAFFGLITVATKRARVDIAMNANAGYQETVRRNGLVYGEGNARVAGVEGDEEIRSRIAEGTILPFVFSGVIPQRGKLQLTARSPEEGSYSTTVTLSDDGDRLSIPVPGEAVTISGFNLSLPEDFRITLGKDICGNRAPQAVIVSPSATRFLWAEPIVFTGRASDAEDSSFPAERLVWSSNRDGKIGNGASIRKNFLTPGTHTISFSVTDSGGRIGTAEKIIEIRNNPPRAPRITSPRESTFYSGQVITFRGWAQDRESGDLLGESLVWRSNLVSGQLGTGELIQTTLPEGTHTISLTATDRERLSSSATITLSVLPRPPGNTPPLVAIMQPEDRTGMGDDECIILVADTNDFEDVVLTGSSLVWSTRFVQGGVTRTRNLGMGERIEMCNPPTSGHDTWHTITVRATDSGGRSSEDSIKIYVIPGGLI